LGLSKCPICIRGSTFGGKWESKEENLSFSPSVESEILAVVDADEPSERNLNTLGSMFPILDCCQDLSSLVEDFLTISPPSQDLGKIKPCTELAPPSVVALNELELDTFGSMFGLL